MRGTRGPAAARPPRRRRPAARAACALVAAWALGAACDAGGSAASEAVVVGPSGEVRLRVRVAVTSTEEARRDGLAVRPPLADDEGLLLDFPVTGEVCLGNAHVGYAIDTVYAGEGGAVVATGGLDAGEEGPRCQQGVRRVLEVRRGVAAAVAPGDALRLR